MDLHDALLALLAPLAPGDELMPGVRVAGALVDAGPRLRFESEGEPIVVEVAPFDVAAPAAATSALLRFAYIAQGPAGRARGFAVCGAVAERARHNERRVLAALSGESDAPRVRDVEVTRLLEPAGEGGRTFHTLSPYVGCLIGCRFCYAQSHVALARRFGRLPTVAWGSYVDVRVNAPEVLRAELESVDVSIVKLCPIVSDPYHVVEERRGVTRACLEVLAAARRPPRALVLTRSRLIVRDAALLGSMRAYAGFSLPTVDDAVRAHFEPRAASVAERLTALETLRAAGARTIAVVQPMLPGPVEGLADALALRCDSVSMDVLRGVEGAAADFGDARYAHAADPAWQSEHALALAEALRARGVALWSGDLPPDAV
jgi:DNA repair photolyase